MWIHGRHNHVLAKPALMLCCCAQNGEKLSRRLGAYNWALVHELTFWPNFLMLVYEAGKSWASDTVYSSTPHSLPLVPLEIFSLPWKLIRNISTVDG